MRLLIAFFSLLILNLTAQAQNQANKLQTQMILSEPALELKYGVHPKGADQPPLLFIHGYTMGAWIFEDNYLPFFYGKGFDVYAINLRGHGKSEGAEGIEWARIDDYFSDLERTVAYLQSETGRDPILIGYSMGAALAQMYIEKYEPDAAVFLSMGDVETGLAHYINWSMRHFPEETQAMLKSGNPDFLHRDPNVQQALFFTKNERPEGFKKYITKLVTQAGSTAVLGDLERLNLYGIGDNTKVLMIAGDQDPLAPAAALQKARFLYHADLVILENTRHGTPVGENWKKGAKAILKFIKNLPDTEHISLMGVEGRNRR